MVSLNNFKPLGDFQQNNAEFQSSGRTSARQKNLENAWADVTFSTVKSSFHCFFDKSTIRRLDFFHQSQLTKFCPWKTHFSSKCLLFLHRKLDGSELLKNENTSDFLPRSTHFFQYYLLIFLHIHPHFIISFDNSF